MNNSTCLGNNTPTLVIIEAIMFSLGAASRLLEDLVNMVIFRFLLWVYDMSPVAKIKKNIMQENFASENENCLAEYLAGRSNNMQ